MINVGSRIMNKVIRTMQKLCSPALNLTPSKVRLLLPLVNEMLEVGSLTFLHKLSSHCEMEPRQLHPAVATCGNVLRVSFSLGLSWPPSAEVPCYPVMMNLHECERKCCWSQVDPTEKVKSFVIAADLSLSWLTLLKLESFHNPNSKYRTLAWGCVTRSREISWNFEKGFSVKWYAG